MELPPMITLLITYLLSPLGLQVTLKSPLVEPRIAHVLKLTFKELCKEPFKEP